MGLGGSARACRAASARIDIGSRRLPGEGNALDAAGERCNVGARPGAGRQSQLAGVQACQRLGPRALARATDRAAQAFVQGGGRCPLLRIPGVLAHGLTAHGLLSGQDVSGWLASKPPDQSFSAAGGPWAN